MCFSALIRRDLDSLSRTYGAVPIREQIAWAREYGVTLAPTQNDRTYPGTYAPVIRGSHGNDGTLELMRYGTYPPAAALERLSDPSRRPKSRTWTSYNARRDNLRAPFWSNALGLCHGVVVVQRFYEWVPVRTLVNNTSVTLEQVRQSFAAQAEQRRQKTLAQGKRWKATPQERLDPLERKIVAEFVPREAQDLLAPVLCSGRDSEPYALGFALITDDPPPEVLRAGHDRCPVFLRSPAAWDWTRPEELTTEACLDLLTQRQSIDWSVGLAPDP